MIILFNGLCQHTNETYAKFLSGSLGWPLLSMRDIEGNNRSSKEAMSEVYVKARETSNVIIDNNARMDHPSDTTSILLYISIKKIAEHMRYSCTSDTCYVLEKFSKLFRRTNTPHRAIGVISQRDIRDVMIAAYDILDKTKKEFIKQIIIKMKFEDQDVIYVRPRTQHAIIIRQEDCTPKELAHLVRYSLVGDGDNLASTLPLRRDSPVSPLTVCSGPVRSFETSGPKSTPSSQQLPSPEPGTNCAEGCVISPDLHRVLPHVLKHDHKLHMGNI